MAIVYMARHARVWTSERAKASIRERSVKERAEITRKRTITQNQLLLQQGFNILGVSVYKIWF